MYLYADVKGKINIRSEGGASYTFVIVNRYFRFVRATPISWNRKVFEQMILFIRSLKCQSGQPVHSFLLNAVNQLLQARKSLKMYALDFVEPRSHRLQLGGLAKRHVNTFLTTSRDAMLLAVFAIE